MIIDCIADLHGFYPQLEGGDLLIIAGDLTANDRGKQYEDFNTWLLGQEYKNKIVIAGNHDNFLTKIDTAKLVCMGAEYLCDSGTEFEGLKIWGSPWTLWFSGVNPKCKAFMRSENYLEKKFSLIPNDIDILITHSPPYGILDKTIDGKNAGSKSLVTKIGLMKNPPKLWVWGHIHEAYGEDKSFKENTCKMINASYVNEYYEPVNNPIRIEL